MAMVLTGMVTGMRPVAGVTEQGKRKGETWAFLSLEIVESRFGKVYSCQLREEDPQYAEFVEDAEEGKLAKDKDLTGHKVKVTVAAQSAGEREMPDGRKVMQIRTQITNIRDLGIPTDDDE